MLIALLDITLVTAAGLLFVSVLGVLTLGAIYTRRREAEHNLQAQARRERDEFVKKTSAKFKEMEGAITYAFTGKVIDGGRKSILAHFPGAPVELVLGGTTEKYYALALDRENAFRRSERVETFIQQERNVGPLGCAGLQGCLGSCCGGVAELAPPNSKLEACDIDNRFAAYSRVGIVRYAMGDAYKIRKRPSKTAGYAVE